MELTWGDRCFVCGKGNQGGLQLEFEIDSAEHTCETRWVPPDTFQGYDGILHGGIVSTLLDECVGKLAAELGLPAVTAELTVRFLRPVPLGRTLRVHGKLTDTGRRVLTGEAQALLEDGSIAARASVKLIRSRT